jgi:drug/metabolite transporter (DMT)-like permease
MTLRDFVLFILLAAIWGASYLFVRIAAPVLGAFLLVDLRVLIAGVALLIYALCTRQLPALRGRWRALFLLSLVNVVIPFVLIANSTVKLNASTAAILNATTPLFTALVSALWLKQRLSRLKLLGFFLGLLGVVVLVGWNPLGLTQTVVLAVCGSLIGALCYGIGAVYIKVAFQGVAPFDMTIGQQFAAGAIMLPLALSAPPHQSTTLLVAGAMLALGVVCTGLAYLIYFDLIQRAGPTSAMSVTFLIPFFGTLWGVLFLHEPLRTSLLIGMAIILAGVCLVTGVALPKAKPRVVVPA